MISCGGNETDPASASSKVSVPSPKIPQKETSQETEKQIVDEQDIEPQPGKKEIVWQKDGAQMALIPAGNFEMGDALQEGEKEEQPVHTIELDAFYMDVHEVTMEQWKKFKGGKNSMTGLKTLLPVTNILLLVFYGKMQWLMLKLWENDYQPKPNGNMQRVEV